MTHNFINSPQKTSHSPWLAFSVAALSIMGSALDRGASNVILPNIAAEFGSDIPTAQWINTTYLLMVAALLLPMGRLTDILGSKKVIVSGLIVFAFGGIGSSVAPSIEILLAGRVLQGIGGAMIQGTAFIIAIAAFGEGQRGKAVGLVLIFVGLGNVAGPAVGGLVTTYAGWRSVFIVTSLVSAAGALLAFTALCSHRPNPISNSQFDWLGAALCVSTLSALLAGITMAAHSGWSFIPITVIALSLVSGGLFVWRGLVVDNPILNLRLFRQPIFGLSILSNLICFLGMSSALFLLPFYLKYVQGYPPDKVGSVFIPAAACMAIASPLSGRLSDRFGTRIFTVGGLLLGTIGLIMLATLDESSHDFLPYIAMIPISAGMGAFYGPNNSAILSVTPDSNQSAVIGFINLIRNSGSLISIPISATIVTLVMSSMGFEANLSAVTHGSETELIASFLTGMRVSFITLTAVTMVGVALSFYPNPKFMR